MSTLALRNYGLVMPNNYVSIDSTEMEYIDGGKITYGYYSAKEGSNMLASTAVGLWACASGATASGIVAGFFSFGILTVVNTLSAGAIGAMATKFTGAYNDCEDIRYKYGNSQKVRIAITTLFGYVTKVAVERW